MSAPAPAVAIAAPAPISRNARIAVLVAALGYFVDIYDLILFSVVRAASLKGIGVAENRLLDVGSHLLDMQMYGMLLGGILWGVLGDRKGRLSVLFGSILMYSIANIANGFVHDVSTYSWLRFVAGIGLAGELGAGVTLVSELLDARSRGWATMIIAGIGIMGAIAAVFVGKSFDWRVAYWIGGAMGLALLALRAGVLESGMFKRVQHQAGVARGNFFALFRSWASTRRYLGTILCAVPIWYAIGIFVTFCPEIGAAMGMSPAPAAADAIMLTYIGLAIGDFISGGVSQAIKSRKRALALFITMSAVMLALGFTVGRTSTTAFYACVLLLGIANGYWAVFVTLVAEQVGTNLRATATTTAPNFVRGAVPLLTFSFRSLREPLGIYGAAVTVGCVVAVVALVSLIMIEDTYGKDLDYVET